MAQTPCKFVSVGDTLDYLSSADKIAGEVVVVGTRPLIVTSAIDYSERPIGAVAQTGIWDVPQNGEVISAGTKVYWDENGNPYGGTALSGCATATSTGNYLIGTAAPLQPNGTAASAATDSYVRIVIDGVSINIATVAGSMTADDITGSDPILTIGGAAGSSSAGGTVVVVGGTGDTGYAGGAVTATGGTGAAGYAGGAITVTGGAPTSGNANGGAAGLVGGAGSGTGVGGAIAITSGASAGATGTAGAIAIDCGAATGGTAGAITIAPTNAASVTFGKMPRIPTATVAVGGTAQANANAVTEGFTTVTGADDTAAVKLPSAVAGMVCTIKSTTASKVLKVFPNTSDAINAGAANAVYNMAALSMRTFYAYDATTWHTDPETPT